MWRVLAIAVALTLSGCAAVPYSSVSTSVDEFTGQVRRQTVLLCSRNFCTQFINVSGPDGADGSSTALIGYEGADWLFVEAIFLKVEGDKDYLTFRGRPEREVLYGGRVSEIMRVKVTNELRQLMKRALGKVVVVRFEGKSVFIDRREAVGANGQWAQFLAAEVF